MTRIPPLVYVALGLALAWALDAWLPLGPFLPAPWRWWLGGLAGGAGLGFFLWAGRLFQLAGTTYNPYSKPGKLVVWGPYRLSRNPMYVGMVGMLLGAGLALGSLSALVPAVLLFLLLDRVFIPQEEGWMAEAFGADFQAWAGRVRRWL